MPRKHAKRKRRKRLPTPPTIEQITTGTREARNARAQVEPPAVSIIKIEREDLLHPASGHGIVIYCTTSYRVTNAEIRRALGRGFRCFLCKDESWLS